MRRFKNLVVGASIASVLIQPLGLVSAARAETVRMEYTDPDHSHAPSQVTVDEQSTTYEYDANGNLVNDGERVISWNQDNLPTKITKDNTEVNLYYDANGTRVAKEVKDKTTGNLISKTIYVNQYYEQSVTSNQSSAAKYYFANGRRIALLRQGLGGSSTTAFLHQDHLGSTVLATNDQSQPTSESLAYLPYGDNVSMSQSVNVSTNYLFTGQEKDAESALYNYNARLYNPKTGAFISADSAGGGNRYSYASNNPMIFTDPTGHAVIADGGGGGGTGSQDADDVLQYEISGGNAYQPPGITATNPLTIGYDPILSEAEVNLLLPGTFEELMLGLAIFSITAPPTIISGIHWLQFLYAYYYYNYFYSAAAEPVSVGQIVASVDASLVGWNWEPRGPGARAGCCGLASNMVRFEAEAGGTAARVYQIRDVHAALGVSGENTFQHGFAVVERGSEKFLVDLTFSQFMDPVSGIIRQNPVSTGVGITDPFAQQLLTQGYVPLTQENLVRYLQLTSSAGVDVSSTTLDVLGSVIPLPWDYTVAELERLTGR